jgi:hypothetical protein
MPIRRLARILAGRATPAQIVLACVLGALLGFAGLGHAPGLTALCRVRLVVLNGNLGLAAVGLALVLAVLVCFLIAEPIVPAFARHPLERANGATVNLERAELNLGGGRIALQGFFGGSKKKES